MMQRIIITLAMGRGHKSTDMPTYANTCVWFVYKCVTTTGLVAQRALWQCVSGWMAQPKCRYPCRTCFCIWRALVTSSLAPITWLTLVSIDARYNNWCTVVRWMSINNGSVIIREHIIQTQCYTLLVNSAGLTTGPLGPGPQAPELQGAPKFSTNNFLGHNH